MTEREQRLRSAVVETATVLYQLAVREHGGNNRGEVVEKLLRDEGGHAGQPWCVAFAAWCYEKSCQRIGEKPVIDANLSTSDLREKARKLGRLVSYAKIQPGDFVVFDFGHTELCLMAMDDDGVILTIGGNTNGAGSADGDGVYKKRRLAGSGVQGVSIAPT